MGCKAYFGWNYFKTFKVLEGSKVGDMQLSFPDTKYKAMQRIHFWKGHYQTVHSPLITLTHPPMHPKYLPIHPPPNNPKYLPAHPHLPKLIPHLPPHTATHLKKPNVTQNNASLTVTHTKYDLITNIYSNFFDHKVK